MRSLYRLATFQLASCRLASHRQVSRGPWRRSYATGGVLCLCLLMGCVDGPPDRAAVTARSASGAGQNVAAGQPIAAGQKVAAGQARAADADLYGPHATAHGDVSDADSTVELLQRVDDSALRAAFAEVANVPHTRYERTGQFDGAGRLLAYSERILQRDGDGFDVVEANASGAFDFGYARRFVAPTIEPADPADLPAYVLPDDPAYASRRNMEAYRYEMTRDATLHGRSVRLLRIEARPDLGDGQAIRRAHVYLEAEDDQIVGIYLERADRALWFREESVLFLSIDQLASGRSVPQHTRFESLVKLPFRPAQRFRRTTTYYGFEPAR